MNIVMTFVKLRRTAFVCNTYLNIKYFLSNFNGGGNVDAGPDCKHNYIQHKHCPYKPLKHLSIGLGLMPI